MWDFGICKVARASLKKISGRFIYLPLPSPFLLIKQAAGRLSDFLIAHERLTLASRLSRLSLFVSVSIAQFAQFEVIRSFDMFDSHLTIRKSDSR